MKKTVDRSFYAFFFAMFIISNCSNLWNGKEATITLNLGGGTGTARSNWYPPNIDELRFEVVFSSSGEFLPTITVLPGSSRNIHQTVSPGLWHINVQAFDKDRLFAAGSAETQVNAGQNNRVTVQMERVKFAQCWASLKMAIDNGNGTETYVLADPEGDWDATETIVVNRGITLLVADGDEITIARGAPDINLLSVETNGKLTLGESGMTGTLTIDGRKDMFQANEASLIRVEGEVVNGAAIEASAELVMYDGVTLTRNRTTGRGGGVHIAPGGAFTMNGGIISNNETVNDWGGGVYSVGPFIMEGGVISGNKATGNNQNYGSGVAIGSWSFGPYALGTFTMNGGEISGNTDASEGGGVYIAGSLSASIFIMRNDAKISGNEANLGGGVYNRMTFIMESGEISGNTAHGSGNDGIGGGVFVAVLANSGGDFEMKGGTIAGNIAEMGAGVAVAGGSGDTPAFTMSGSARVDVDNEVFLDDNFSSSGTAFRAIRVEGNLTGTIPVATIQPRSYFGLVDQQFELPRTVLTGDVAENHTKFTVVPSGTEPNLQHWGVDAAGELQRISRISSWTALRNEIMNQNGENIIFLAHSTNPEAWYMDETIEVGRNITLIPAGEIIIQRGVEGNTNVNFVVHNGGSLTLGEPNMSGTLIIDGNKIESLQSLIHVNGGSLIMYDGVTLKNGNSTDGGAVSMSQTGLNNSFTMHGGTINENNANSGGGVYVSGNGGTFTMHGGTISRNTAISGSGVFLGNSSTPNAVFNMDGGEISENIASYQGGGVYVANYATFTMTGGSIYKNKTRFGGGIDMTGGTLLLSGDAHINGNETENGGGGGINAGNGANITMTGGYIYDNKADDWGGGILLESGSSLEKTGGVITGSGGYTADGTALEPNLHYDSNNDIVTPNAAYRTAWTGGITMLSRTATAGPDDDLTTDPVYGWD